MPALIENFISGQGFTEALAEVLSQDDTDSIQSAIDDCPPDLLSDFQYLVSTAATCVIVPGSQPPAFLRLITIPILIHDADSRAQPLFLRLSDPCYSEDAVQAEEPMTAPVIKRGLLGPRFLFVSSISYQNCVAAPDALSRPSHHHPVFA